MRTSRSSTRHTPCTAPLTTSSSDSGRPIASTTSAVISPPTSRPTAATSPCLEPKWYPISALFSPAAAATFAIVRPAYPSAISTSRPASRMCSRAPVRGRPRGRGVGEAALSMALRAGSGCGALRQHRRVEPHGRELLRERLRRVLEDFRRVVERRLEVVRVVDPRRDEDQWRDRQALLEGVLDDPRVGDVGLDRVGQELDAEAHVP